MGAAAADCWPAPPSHPPPPQVPEKPVWVGPELDWLRRPSEQVLLGKLGTGSTLWQTISPTVAIFPQYPELVEIDRTLMCPRVKNYTQSKAMLQVTIPGLWFSAKMGRCKTLC